MPVYRYNPSKKIPSPNALGGVLDAVTFEPHPACPVSMAPCVAAAAIDSWQSAGLMWLPETIVGATRVRWKYIASAAAANTFYQLGFYTKAGIFIIGTGINTAVWSATANQALEVSLTIAATSFLRGWYYVWIGNAPATGGTSNSTAGMNPGVTGAGAGGSHGVGAPGVCLFSGALGGQTAPANLSAYTDSIGQHAIAFFQTIPIVTLSVG